jgi:hypothetical protein
MTLDWVAAILAIVAYGLLAKRMRFGWAINVGSLACWIIFALQKGIYSLVFVNSVLLVTSAYGFLAWTKKEK